MFRLFRLFNYFGGGGSSLIAHLIQQEGFAITQQDGSLFIFNDGVSESTLSSMSFSNTNNSGLIELLQSEFIL